MRVPLLDLSKQYQELAGPIQARIEQVLATQRFILGPNVEQFETAMADFLGLPHAIGVSSGTDALLLALMALEIGPADAVVVPGYSFFATAGCVARLGATPIFVDIDPATYNISVAALKELLETRCQVLQGEVMISPRDDDRKMRLRAIIPVHLFGLCCDMDAIQEMSRQYGIALIEDAAQAIGAEYRTRDTRVHRAGAMGKIGCFSFYPSKNLGAAGDAGLVACRDEDLAHRLQIARQHGMAPRYFHHVIGGNFRLDEIQAAILAVKLPYLERWAAGRRRAADLYRHEFGSAKLLPLITLPAEPYRTLGLTNHHVYHQYVIRTPKRDALRQHLLEHGVSTEIYYPLGLHEQKCFEYLGYAQSDLIETARAARETLALPIWPGITDEAQAYVVSTIAEFFRA